MQSQNYIPEIPIVGGISKAHVWRCNSSSVMKTPRRHLTLVDFLLDGDVDFFTDKDLEPYLFDSDTMYITVHCHPAQWLTQESCFRYFLHVL